LIIAQQPLEYVSFPNDVCTLADINLLENGQGVAGIRMRLSNVNGTKPAPKEKSTKSVNLRFKALNKQHTPVLSDVVSDSRKSRAKVTPLNINEYRPSHMETAVNPSDELDADLKFFTENLRVQATKNVDAINKLRKRVAKFPGRYQVPFFGNKEVEDRFRKLFSKCQICAQFDCEHNLAIQQKDREARSKDLLKKDPVKPKRVYSFVDKTPEEIDKARMQWVARNKLRNKFLKLEKKAHALRTVEESQRPRAVRDDIALAVEFLVMKTVHSEVEEQEVQKKNDLFAQKQAKDEEHKRKRKLRREAARLEKQKHKKSKHQKGKGVAISEKPLFISFERTGESNFRFIQSEPVPFNREKLVLRVHGRNIHI